MDKILFDNTYQENDELDSEIGETERKKLKMDHFSQLCNEVLPVIFQ